ncbi:hypothetical protein HN014_09275 [Aquimarina sp. TRL1]|uniref:hypothetical protein n=1 Tax=Aquimarina sp. (strain TRL1) TaxID=2736252 RepID=UPI00158DE2AA|nr:hypothetical protein [Aquimarina sp. TRL1]QKX05101.1 hypothetical protein HN014_09275 [Aquimarina sp. TRL1]
MTKLIKILFLFFFLYGCKTGISELIIKQNDNQENVIVNYSSNMNQFWAINIPIKIEIENTFQNQIKLVDHKYLYNNKGTFSKVYEIIGHKNIKPIKEPVIGSGANKSFIIYSKHFIDTIKFKKEYFSKRGNLKLESDYHINDILEFKREYTALATSILKKDTIKLTFFDTKTDNFFVKRIPVKW